ncbi:MAG: PEP-CTERM sorting domain-containing protein [Armatimonadota bacterium]
MRVSKVALIAVVLILVFTASTAMASWKFNMTVDGTNYTRIGESGASTGSASLVSGSKAGVFVYDPSVSPTGFLSVDSINALTEGQSRTWTVLVWAGSTYSQPISLGWRFPSASYAIPAKIGNTPYTLKVKVVNDPTGEHVGWSKVIPTDLGTSYVYDLKWNNLTNIKYDQTATTDLAPATNGKAVKLEVSWAPTASNVPEPGSILALATGLIGLAGGIIRRKK